MPNRSTTARHRSLLVAATAAGLLLTGCAGADQPAAPSTTADAPATTPTGASTGSATSSSSPAGEVEAEGTLENPGQAQNAVTYDPALAPVGARMEVAARASGSTTTVRLEVEGLLPDRGYAAHAHVMACGATGDVAGPHFQNQLDPAATPQQPSTDPAYANPENEVWLDLRTDGEGEGEATAEVPFTFTDRAPASVVLHAADATATEAGQAGTAGARPACLTVPFDRLAG